MCALCVCGNKEQRLTKRNKMESKMKREMFWFQIAKWCLCFISRKRTLQRMMIDSRFNCFCSRSIYKIICYLFRFKLSFPKTNVQSVCKLWRSWHQLKVNGERIGRILVFLVLFFNFFYFCSQRKLKCIQFLCCFLYNLF